MASTTATIRKRSKIESALTDSTCTPKALADLLPRVSIDPCSNPRSWIHCEWSYSLEKKLDGLKLPWRGTGFINFPFSKPMPFVDKAIIEMACGNCVDLIVLAKLDSSTAWWREITSWSPAFPRGHILSVPPERWDFFDRVQYDEHPAVIEQRRLERVAEALKKGKSIDNITGESTSNFCSVIIHRRGFFPDGRRRPALQLDDVATRWIQP